MGLRKKMFKRRKVNRIKQESTMGMTNQMPIGSMTLGALTELIDSQIEFQRMEAEDESLSFNYEDEFTYAPKHLQVAAYKLVSLAAEREWREQAEECMRGHAAEASELRVENERLEKMLADVVAADFAEQSAAMEEVPRWPTASHFKDWEWAPLTISSGARTKVVDLYWCVGGGRPKGELLIGIQMSSKDGDYFSPFIDTNNSLHSCYKDRPWVVEAYRIACKALGILPQWYDSGEQQLIPIQEIPHEEPELWPMNDQGGLADE